MTDSLTSSEFVVFGKSADERFGGGANGGIRGELSDLCICICVFLYFMLWTERGQIDPLEEKLRGLFIYNCVFIYL